jgi:integrase
MVDGTFVERTDETVAEYLHGWLAGLGSARRVKPKTLITYQECLARLVPHLAATRLQALRPIQLEQAYTKLLTTGGRTGSGVHPRTVLHSHRVLRKALADAERLGLVARNPARNVELPALPALTTVDNTWTAQQLRSFLSDAADEPLHAAFVLAATTGMRRGEIAALRWSDIDLDARVLHVQQSVTPVRGVLIFTAPKTRKGARTIGLDPNTVAVLRRHRARQREEQLAAGPCWPKTGRVFTSADGSLLHPDKLSNRFEARQAHLGLPRLTFHGLRHTWATLALEKGIHTKVVSERLGHATAAVTLDVYSKVRPRLDAEAAALVAADLFP